MTRTFLPLAALLTALPSAGCMASDGRTLASADTPQAVVQLAADDPQSPPRPVLDPTAINKLLGKRSPGQAHVSWMASFRDQIRRCWKPPSGKPLAGPFAIDVDVSLRPDGTLAGEPILVHQSDAADHPEVVASVLKAIKSCAPFRLRSFSLRSPEDSSMFSRSILFG